MQNLGGGGGGANKAIMRDVQVANKDQLNLKYIELGKQSANEDFKYGLQVYNHPESYQFLLRSLRRFPV